MLSDRQRGVLFKTAAIGIVFGGIAYVVGSGGAGYYGNLAVLLLVFVMSITAVHITAMGYHKERSVLAAIQRATIAEYGWLLNALVIVAVGGFLLAETTSGNVQQFVLLATVSFGLLGVAATVTVGVGKAIRSYL